MEDNWVLGMNNKPEDDEASVVPVSWNITAPPPSHPYGP
jgi:hypothetical protein